MQAGQAGGHGQPTSPKEPQVVLEMDVMDSVTDNPAPEPGAMEQLFAWLDAFPAVSPWVNWLLAILVFWTVLVSNIIIWLWSRWGENLWVARSTDRSKKRATNLRKKVLRAHALCRNRPAMFNHLAIFLAGCILISTLLILSFILRASIVSIVTFFGSYVGAWYLVFWYQLNLAPLRDIDRYTRQSRAHIEGLLTKANVPQEDASRQLKEFDDQVDAARNQEIR